MQPLPDNVPFVERQPKDPYISREEIDAADRWFEAQWQRNAAVRELHEQVRRAFKARVSRKPEDHKDLTG